MSDINIPSENDPQRLDLSQENIDKVMVPLDTSERSAAAQKVDLTDEIEGLITEREDLAEQIRGGNDDPALVDRYAQIEHDLRTAQGDLDTLRGPIVTDQADNDIISE